MNLDHIQFKLSQLLDGDLPEREANALRQRMAEDPQLAEEFRLYQAIEQNLAGAGADLPGVDWDSQRQSIHETLEREALLKDAQPIWAKKTFRWAASVTAAAAAIMLMVLAMGRFLPSGSDSTQIATPAGNGGGTSVATPATPARTGAAVAPMSTTPRPGAVLASAMIVPPGVNKPLPKEELVVSYLEPGPGDVDQPGTLTTPVALDSGATSGTVVVSAGAPVMANLRDSNSLMSMFGDM